MKIKEVNNSLVLYDNDEKIGEITWEKQSKVLIIDHTFVEPEFNNQGLGKKLVMAIVTKARKEDLKLVAICPYAKKILQDEKYADVMRK